MDPSDLEARLNFARAVAHEAGAVTLDYFRRDDLAIERKGDRSPVTRADREAEQLLRRRIAQAYPDDGILGEEFGEQPGSSSHRWVLDPLDGTQSFVRGVPLYGTMVGLESAGDAVLGVVYLPALGELVSAATGLGAWWSLPGEPAPRRARASQVDDLQDALFCTTWVDGFERIGRRDLYDRLLRASGADRGWGDCYGHVLVATGRAEVMVDPVMNVWDAAALKPILEEAGGTFTDLAGTPTIHGGNAVSTNGRLFDAVMRVVRQPQ